jgi:hypothetical protein
MWCIYCGASILLAYSEAGKMPAPREKVLQSAQDKTSCNVVDLHNASRAALAIS